MRETPRRDEARRALERFLRGQSKKGAALPSIRVLARQLGFSKNTLSEAIEELKAEGQLRAEPRKGLFVEAPRAVAAKRLALSRVGGRALPEVLRSGLPSGDGERVVSIGAPVPPPSFFHTPELTRFLSQRRLSLADLGGYPDPSGLPSLRDALVHFSARFRGPPLESEQLVVTGGATQAVALLLSASRASRSRFRVAVEVPGSFVWFEQVRALGGEVVPISRRAAALDLERLDAEARRGLSAFLVCPDHHDPTGGVLSATQRTALLELSMRRGLSLIELHTHLGLSFGSPSLAAMAPGQVTSVLSLSRVFGAGWRLGAVMAPVATIEALRSAVLLQSLGHPVLVQRLLAQWLGSNELEPHLEALRATLAASANATEQRRASFADLAEWMDPWERGLFRRLRLDSIDLDEATKAGASVGINLHPERLFDPSAKRSRWLRVNLAQGDEALELTLQWLAGRARAR